MNRIPLQAAINTANRLNKLAEELSRQINDARASGYIVEATVDNEIVYPHGAMATTVKVETAIRPSLIEVSFPGQPTEAATPMPFPGQAPSITGR